MYVINIGQRAEHRTTLAGVLQYLNDDRDGKAAPRVDDIALRHVERGAIRVVKLGHGKFAVRPQGTRRAILSMILDEVDRFIVRVGGKILRPHEMSRAAWGAVVAAGRLAYFPEEAIDMSEDDAGPLFQTVDLFEDQGPFDITAFVCGEFVRRFGYGTNGPLYHPAASPNCRHEVHVAYALMRGEKVRDCIINTYRDNPHHTRSEPWMQPLIEVPALRGSLSPSVLQALCRVIRGEKLEITPHNAPRLLAAVRNVPSDGGYVAVDDALFAAGLVPPRTMPTPKPLEGENARPATKLAARIHGLICERQYQEAVKRRPRSAKGRGSANASLIARPRRPQSTGPVMDTIGPTGWRSLSWNAILRRYCISSTVPRTGIPTPNALCVTNSVSMSCNAVRQSADVGFSSYVVSQ